MNDSRASSYKPSIVSSLLAKIDSKISSYASSLNADLIESLTSSIVITFEASTVLL